MTFRPFKNDNFYFSVKKSEEAKEKQRKQIEKQKNRPLAQRIEELKKQGLDEIQFNRKKRQMEKQHQKVQQKHQKEKQQFEKNSHEIQKHMIQPNEGLFRLQSTSQSKKSQIDDNLAMYKKMKSEKKITQTVKKEITQTKIEEQPSNKQTQKVVLEEKIENKNTTVKAKPIAEKQNDSDEEIMEALRNTHLQQQELCKPQNVLSGSQNMSFTLFNPKSTLQIKEIAKQEPKYEKTEVEMAHQKRREEQKMKRQLKKLQNDAKENDQGSDDEKKEGQKTGKKNKNKKATGKIKKQNNYVAQNLKNGYKDRFRGGIRELQLKYQKNGILKEKYRLAQSQIEMDNAQLFRTFDHSLSSAFHVQVYIGEDGEEEEVQEREKVEIPSIKDSNKPRLTRLINDLFGFQSFREGQFQVINNVLNQKSTIFVSETASGKSLTYIISSLIMANEMNGMSIVISPLIALMLDQLEHLPDEIPAACISSLLEYEQKIKIVNMVKKGEVKLLFMTPETLMSDILYHVRQFPPVNFVCIDEAHCLSELSHNFRNSYLALSQIIKTQINYNTPDGSPNILCLTATANTQTIESLSRKLQIVNIIRSSSTLNKNLYITITREVGSQAKYQALVDYLSYPEIKQCEAVMIYCRSKYLIDKVFNYLNNSNISATVFHGQLPNKEKTRVISEFKSKKIKVIISTTALGMGLDFQHLDCVVHFNMPKSLQSFVQETGRAGRRYTRAYCHLFLDQSDFFIERNYILADQLENHSMSIIANDFEKSILRPSSKANFKSQKKVSKPKKMNKEKQEEEMERVIKKASMKIEQIQQENLNDEEMKQMLDELSNGVSQSQFPNEEEEQQSQLTKRLFFVRAKELAQKCYLREESLLTILMSISQALNKQFSMELDRQVNVIKVLPMSSQTLKLSFFKSNQAQLLKDKTCGDFFKQLIDYDESTKKAQCKNLHGAYMIQLIQKCNEMDMNPTQMMSKVYEVTNLFTMKIEYLTECFVFELRLGQGITQKKIIEKITNKAFHQKVIEKVHEMQNNSMTKLNVFYSLAFDWSQVSVNQIQKKKLLIPRDAPIPQHNIMNEITKYFNTDLISFYNYVAETEDPEERQIYLPTELVEPSQKEQIFQYIKLFFKHQYSNLRDVNNVKEAQNKKEALIQQYQDGKVITRVFLGVNEEKSSRVIFGDHKYWRMFIRKKYQSLLKTVRELIMVNRSELLAA